MFNSIEKILYFTFFMLFTIIRKFYTAKFGRTKIIISVKKVREIILLTITGIGMVVPLVYVFSAVLDFADYQRPFWITAAGIAVFIIASLILWFSHHDLKSNWTVVPAITEGHTLVNSGIYKYIRHPMYAAHLYWALGQMLVLPNLIAGFSFAICIGPMLFFRITEEEKLLYRQFGEKYREYQKNTGRFFPLFRKRK